MSRVRAARLLTTVVVVQLLSALLVPASFGLAFCRSGGQMHDCCARPAQPADQRLDTPSCCSVQGTDHGAPPAEHAGRADGPAPVTPVVLARSAPLPVTTTKAPRPPVRALGPPIRLITSSFLL